MKVTRYIVLILSINIISSIPASADVIRDLNVAEATFGVDNSDKSAIERVEILEEELGITDGQNSAVVDRIKRIESELGISGVESEGSADIEEDADEYEDAVEEVDADTPDGVLKKYFHALNEFDIQGAIGTTMNDVYGFDYTKVSYYIDHVGLYPGVMYTTEFLKYDPELYTEYLRGLGYHGDYKEIVKEFDEDIENGGEMLFSNFNVTYDIVDMKNTDECNFQQRVGLSTTDVPDIKEIIKDDYDLDEVGDAYVAKMKLYWEYNGLPYGENESVWQNSVLSEGKDSFDEYLADRYESIDYYAVIYECDGQWYLYFDSFGRWVRNWIVEM